MKILFKNRTMEEVLKRIINFSNEVEKEKKYICEREIKRKTGTILNMLLKF